MSIFIKSIAVALIGLSSFVAQSAYAACQGFGNYTRGSSAVVGGYRIAGGSHTAYYNIGSSKNIANAGSVSYGAMYDNNGYEINNPLYINYDSAMRVVYPTYNGNTSLAQAEGRFFTLNAMGNVYVGQNHDAFFGNICVDTQLPAYYITINCQYFRDCIVSTYVSNVPSIFATYSEYFSKYFNIKNTSNAFSSMKTGSCPSGTRPIQATNYRTQDGILRSGTYILCVQC